MGSCDPIVDGVAGGGFSLQQQLSGIRQGFWIEEHFLGEDPDANLSGSHSFLETSSGGGTANVLGPATANAYGVGQLTLPINGGAGPEDGAQFRQQISSVAANGLFGVVGFTMRLLVDAPPAAGQVFDMYGGVYQGEVNQRVSSDGIYWFADENSANWILRVAVGGANTDDDSGVAVATSTFQTLHWVADIGVGTVQGFIDGSLVATVTPADINPNQIMQAGVGIHGDAAVARAATVETLVDWIGWGCAYGSPL